MFLVGFCGARALGTLWLLVMSVVVLTLVLHFCVSLLFEVKEGERCAGSAPVLPVPKEDTVGQS